MKELILILALMGLPFAALCTEEETHTEATSPDTTAHRDFPPEELDPLTVCKRVYKPYKNGRLVSEDPLRLKASTVYARFNSEAGYLLFVMTDDAGKMDTRPLGVGTVVPCSAVENAYIDDKRDNPRWGDCSRGYSEHCELSASATDSWVRLCKDINGAPKSISIRRLTSRLEGTGADQKRVWEVSTGTNLPTSEAAPGSTSSTTPLPTGTTLVDDQGRRFTWVTINGQQLKQLEGHRVEEFPPGGGRFYNVTPGSRLAQLPGDVVRMVPEGHELRSFTRSDGSSTALAVPVGTGLTGFTSTQPSEWTLGVGFTRVVSPGFSGSGITIRSSPIICRSG